MTSNYEEITVVLFENILYCLSPLENFYEDMTCCHSIPDQILFFTVNEIFTHRVQIQEQLLSLREAVDIHEILEKLVYL